MAGTTPVNPQGATDSTWERLKEAGEFERHFNQLQSGYRTLASTWLLAAFAGVGFTFINNKTIPFHLWLAVAAGIGFLGAVGIVLIWVIDMLVYNQLLNGVFFTAVRLEKKAYADTDQFRSNMTTLARFGGVTRHVMWFYMGATTALLLVATATAIAWAIKSNGPWLLAAGVGIVLAIIANILIQAGTVRCRCRVQTCFGDLVSDTPSNLQRWFCRGISGIGVSTGAAGGGTAAATRSGG